MKKETTSDVAIISQLVSPAVPAPTGTFPVVGTGGETTPSEYAEAISAAAKEYRRIKSGCDLYRTDVNHVRVSYAYEKLCWMIDAERFGWEPSKYEPEN